MASGTRIVLSPGTRVDVNNVPYRTTSGSYQVVADVPPSTDTENPNRNTQHAAGGLRTLFISLNANLDTDDSDENGAPTVGWADPASFDISPGKEAYVRIWPQGRLMDNSDISGVLIMQQGSGGWNVSGSSPESITVNGVNRDKFKLSGEDALSDDDTTIDTVSDTEDA